MITWSRVEQLRRELGDEDFNEIVASFLEEVEEVIARLNAGFDADTIGTDLHFLKGSALNLGFRDFAAMCQEGETAARYGRAGPAHAAQVIACYENSKSVFLARLGPQSDRRAG